MKIQLVLIAALACACGKGGGAKAEESAEEAKAPEPGVVTLTPEQATFARLALGKAETRSTTGLLVATAEVVPSGDGVARVGPRLAGRITALKAGVGDHVKRGQALAYVESPDVEQARADHHAAIAAWKVAQQNLERERGLAAKQISANRDLELAEAEEARARSAKDAAASRLRTMGVGVSGAGSSFAVLAPIEGEVVERVATLGQMAEPSDAMFVVMDLRQVWVLVDVFERDLTQVKVGQPVEARVAAYPERAFSGTVAAIGAVVESKTRAVQVRVVLPNGDRALKPGMFATVEVQGTTGVAHDRVVVPAAAIQRDGDRHLVFVPRGEHDFVARPVKIGREAAGWVEVEDGVAAGETVVTTGAFVLKSETRKGEMGEE